MTTVLSLSVIEQYGPLVQAVREGRRVRYMDADGTVIEGVLRHFVPSSGTSAHLRADADLTQSWVRISGTFEIWVRTVDLVFAEVDGRLAID
jgi:hypothetical protein